MPTTQRRPSAYVVLAVGAVACAAVGCLLAVRTTGPSTLGARTWTFLEVLPVTLGSVALIRLLPTHPVSRGLTTMAFALGLGTAAYGLLWTLGADRAATANPVALGVLQVLVAASLPAMMVTFAVLLLSFPAGMGSAGARVTARGLIGYAVLEPLLWLLTTAVLPPEAGAPWLNIPGRNPVHVAALDGLHPLAAALHAVPQLALFVGLIGLVVRWRCSTGRRRDALRIAVLVVAFITAEAMLVVTFLAAGLIDERTAAALPCVFLIPLVLAVTVLRHDVLDMTPLGRATLAYGGLCAVLTGGYALAVAAAGASAGSRLPAVTVALLTAAVLVSLAPLRRRAQQAARTWVMGRSAPAGELLLRAGALLETAYDVAELAPLLAQLVRDSLGLTGVRITVLIDERTPQLGEIVGVAGAATGPLAGSLDLIHAGEVLGRMEYGEKERGVLTPEDEALLAGMARQAGLAIRNARLSAELAGKVEETRSQAAEIVASRARLVSVQDDERRRLERDLHDGAQQQIVAVMAKLRLVRNRLARAETSAGPDVTGLLEELQDDTRLLLDELRELAHGIRPPVLADRGLVEALETRAARLPLSVQIQADPAARSARYADDIEGCAWFAVNEAIANAIKHADADAVVVAVDELEGRLLVVVADDGVGFSPPDQPSLRRGRGLANLRDRVEALDGRLAVTSRLGAGTRLSIELPAQRPAPVSRP